MAEFSDSLFCDESLELENLRLFEDLTSENAAPDTHPEKVVSYEDTHNVFTMDSGIVEESLSFNNRATSLDNTMDTNMKPIEHWNSENILDWICKECTRNGMQYEDIPIHNFRSVTIHEFRNMEFKSFLRIVENEEYASFLYNCKEKLFTTCADRKSKKVEDWTSFDIADFICQMYHEHDRDYEIIPIEIFGDIDINSFKQMSVDNFHQLIGNRDDAEFLYKCKNSLFGCNLYNTHQADYITPFHQVNGSLEVNNNHMLSFCHKTIPTDNPPVRTTNYVESNTTIKQVRKRGRPRTKEVQPVKNEGRTGKLWEFLIKLLKDPATNPRLIKWEDYDQGTFKFVQNEKVAKMWGERKSNVKMNYEKFSRAMRYYYRNKILQPVSGKRLVYKFGPNSTGWRDSKPIL